MPLEGLTTWVEPTQPTPTLNPGLLDFIGNALDNLASTATNKKAIFEQLIASNSSLAISNSTLTNQLKTLCNLLAAKSGVAEERGWTAMTPTGGRELTLRASADPMDTVLDMVTLATPAPATRKVTSSLPRATTSWAVPLPIRTRYPTGPPEAPGLMNQQNLSLLRPLIY